MADGDRVVVEVVCPIRDAEVVADRLLVLGASAVAEQPGPSADEMVLTADLPSSVLDAAVWPGVEVRVVDPGTEWLDAWREYAGPVRAGRFVVRPPWVDRATAFAGPSGAGEDEGSLLELVVDPGHTFGSGTHETTRLCLELLGRVVDPGDTVLDVGCGSGILSVGALLLGAGRATGVDVDAGSAEVSVEAAEANAVGDRYSFSGAAVPDGRFDVVVANMLLSELEPIGAVLSEAVGGDGVIVLSGFLADQRARAIGALGNPAVQWSVFEVASDGDWRAVALRAGPGDA